MSRRYQKALMIFRRDLRLEDNTALIAASRLSESVVPAFIYDPRQIERNSLRNDFALRFMVESIVALDKCIQKLGGRLIRFHERPEQVVSNLVREKVVDAVFVNRDYTPFAISRDKAIAEICRKYNVDFHSFNDALLTKPEEVHKSDGSPYTVFTPFYRRAAGLSVREPIAIRQFRFTAESLPGEISDVNRIPFLGGSVKGTQRGGRAAALKIVRSLSEFENYEQDRDFPSRHATTGLSPHLKFGTVSARKVYHDVLRQLGEGHPLIRQLYWRDFFIHIGYHFPSVCEQSFRPEYRDLDWNTDREALAAWQEGRTGFPIVDAGMRQLNATGCMHNRVRMIAASFLVKDLHIDWREGERYFAQKLVDYDRAVNNGNWQWVASTGCDAVPYFRIFNPWIQQRRYDPQGAYIRQWIPEFRKVETRLLHNPSRPALPGNRYPAPIVNHDIASRIAKRLFARTGRITGNY